MPVPVELDEPVVAPVVAPVPVVVVLDVVVLDVVVGLHGPQTPLVLPTGMRHVSPPQQSALFVQRPQAGSHETIAQMYGGVPLGFGTHGRLLQQLALEAHAAPAGTQVPGEHLGTPTLSRLHVYLPGEIGWLQLPLQQSHDELHDVPCSLQTSPSGLQPMGFEQTPTVNGAVIAHVTGMPEPPGRPAAPQQSVSFVQRSPTG